MPGIDGYETCRRLKAMPDLAEVPVIFLTARTDLEGIVTAFEAGGADYVTKPFQQEELASQGPSRTRPAAPSGAGAEGVISSSWRQPTSGSRSRYGRGRPS